MAATVAPTPLLSPGLDLAAMTNQGRPNNEQAMNAAATGFESVFMSLLIKQMRQTADGSSLLFGKDAGDVLGGLFDHFMGQHLAQSGSLGIAAMIKKSWQMQANQGQHGGQAASPVIPSVGCVGSAAVPGIPPASRSLATAADPTHPTHVDNHRNQVNRAYHANQTRL